MIEFIRAMRPRQWTKNLIIFAALVFAERPVGPKDIVDATVAFLIFCVLSGSVYVINDFLDLEADKVHPVKSKRPLASGKLAPVPALSVAVVLSVASLGGSTAVSPGFALAGLAYFGLQLAYFFALKNMVILDVMSVAAGFVLRAVAGALAIAVPISPWLLMCTILLALFLALGKRRHELVLLSDGAQEHRRILKEYSAPLLDEMISVVTSSTVVAYTLYTFFSETAHRTPYLMLTVPFVLYGIFRYLYLVHQKEMGGSPEEILVTDRPLLLNVFLWFAAVAVIMRSR